MGTVDDIELQRRMQAYNESPILETIKKLLSINNGRWEGSASDLRKWSQLSNCRKIEESSEKIGKFINNNKEFLLWYDNIKVVDGVHRKRIFTTVPTVQTDTTVPTVQTVQGNRQQELDI